MFRSCGSTSFTTWPPIRTSPLVGDSRPAVMRNTVVFPEPDGPTSTTNSPSSITSSKASTAIVPPAKTFVSSWYSMLAIPLASVPRGRDAVAVPERAPLRDAALGLVVDVDDPEPLGVAVLPLEVVEQGPDVVAAHVNALRTRAFHRVDVTAEVRDAFAVVHDGVAVEAVFERSAVLRDQQRDVAVVAVDPQQELGQRIRNDRPPHRSPHSVDLDVARSEHAVLSGDDEIRPIEVDAEEVERLRDRLEVAVADRAERPDVRLVQSEHVLGVGTAEQRIEEPPVVVAVEPERCCAIRVRRSRRRRDRQVERDPDL